jgi:hypothetical protein
MDQLTLLQTKRISFVKPLLYLLIMLDSAGNINVQLGGELAKNLDELLASLLLSTYL